MSLLYHEDNDDPLPGEEIDSGDSQILGEAATLLVIILTVIAALTCSGCGGSSAEDDEKSLQPVPCAQDRKNCV